MKSDWELRLLGDIAEIVMGQSPPGHSYNAGGIGLPLLNGPTEFGLRYPVPTQFTTAPVKVSRPGDVIFCVRGSTTGRMNTADRQYCLGRGVAAIRGATNEDTRFIHALLQSELPRLLAVVSGSTFPNLSRADLRGFEVLWPDLDHRRRIAGVLEALDDKIEVEQQKREHLDLAIRVVGTHLIRDGATEWPRERIGGHFVTARGLSYTGAGLAKHGSGVPLHNLNSVLEGGGYKFEGIKYYVGDSKERHVVRPGDLVVANTEQGFGELLIGFPAMVPSLFGSKGIYSHHLHRVTPLKTSCLSRCWLYVWLLDPANHDLVAGYANGTTVNMLPVSALEDPVVPVPPPERIRLLDEVVVPLLAEIEGSVKQANQLSAVRDVLLPKLVSGQIRVQESYDPDDVLGTVAEEAGAAV